MKLSEYKEMKNMLQKENREWFEKLQKFLIADERQRNKKNVSSNMFDGSRL